MQTGRLQSRRQQLFGLRHGDSGSHFSNGASDDVGQIVHQNIVGLGPSRYQGDCAHGELDFFVVVLRNQSLECRADVVGGKGVMVGSS